jgi:DNA-directed RNA polymerase sigma subunit (sigma70/sigma32)
MKLLLFAAQKFQPSAGVKFKTFLDTYLKGLYRYVAKNQNVARIPEHQVREITRYKNTKEILRVQKNREPTHEEMGDALGWAPSQAQRLETSLSRRDIAASGLPTSPEVLRINEKMEEVLEFEYFSRMTPKEKLVYDYSLGKHGRPRLDTVKAIAAKTGLTEGDVYAVKRSLAQRVMGQL